MIVLAITAYSIYTDTLRKKINKLILSADCPEFYIANLESEYPEYARELALEDYILQENL